MERLFDERRCRMERLENDIVYVTVYLNNGYSFAGYLYKDDLEDALNGYYNDDKYFMRIRAENGETIIYMKNVLMISAEKQKEEKKNESHERCC